MLVSIIVNLNMLGGVIPPPTDHGGDGVAQYETQNYIGSKKEDEERLKKQAEQEEEELILSVSHWLINYN